jgi:hypothetical protein
MLLRLHPTSTHSVLLSRLIDHRQSFISASVDAYGSAPYPWQVDVGAELIRNAAFGACSPKLLIQLCYIILYYPAAPMPLLELNPPLLAFLRRCTGYLSMLFVVAFLSPSLADDTLSDSFSSLRSCLLPRY